MPKVTQLLNGMAGGYLLVVAELQTHGHSRGTYNFWQKDPEYGLLLNTVLRSKINVPLRFLKIIDVRIF